MLTALYCLWLIGFKSTSLYIYGKKRCSVLSLHNKPTLTPMLARCSSMFYVPNEKKKEHWKLVLFLFIFTAFIALFMFNASLLTINVYCPPQLTVFLTINVNCSPNKAHANCLCSLLSTAYALFKYKCSLLPKQSSCSNCKCSLLSTALTLSNMKHCPLQLQL